MPVRIKGQNEPTTIDTRSSSPHGSYHLAENSAIYEPQRSNNFEFIIVGLPANLPKAGGQSGQLPDGSNLQEYLRLSVDESFVPHSETNVLTVSKGNSTMKFAGRPTFQGGDVVFNDYIGANTVEILEAWYNQVNNIITEKTGLMSDYKKTAYLIEYTPDWQEVRRYIYKGIWPNQLSEGNYSNNSDEMRKITCTFAYDKAMLDYSDTKII